MRAAFPTRAFAVALCLLPTWALGQDGARPSGTATPAAQPEEEITVIAPRRTVPDFQTFDEFQRAEFEKIRGRFEAPPPPEPRGDEVLSSNILKSPNEQSDVRRMIREAPRVRDLAD